MTTVLDCMKEAKAREAVQPRYLVWRNAVKCAESSLSLPSPMIDWKLEQVPDHPTWRAFKRCYKIEDDNMYWVPLNGGYETQEEAHQAVRRYLVERHPVFLDDKGEIVPS